jgi:hypothetical protein
MASVVQSIIEPDQDAIQSHLETLFAPCRDEYPAGLVELRYGADFTTAYFNLAPVGIAEAAAFAANRNREGANVYVGVNPRRPGTKRPAHDTDIAISYWQFADLDDAEAVEMAGKRLKPLPPTMTVTTGTEPHRRPHFYWRLDEPVGNMDAWTQRQRGIAQTLDSDPAVVNASRIMRLAGTVSFPSQDKLQRGYRVELTTLRTVFSDERGPVTPAQIETVFPAGVNTNQNNGLGSNSGQSPARGQSTLQGMRRTQISDLIDACLSGTEWHKHMIRLVAHLAAVGRTSAEIMALAEHITMPGFTADQTRREMQTALTGARTKWTLPEPEDDVAAEEGARDDADSTFPLLDMEELENMPPPVWLIHDMIAADGLSIIYGEPGAGKSFIALDMALRLAHGMDWHGTRAKPCGVLYIAGEGARGIGKRVKGWRQEHAMEGVEAPFLLLPVAVQLLDEKERTKLLRTIDAAAVRAGFPIALTVVDTVSRALAGSDENGQEAMSAFVKALDIIKAHAGGAALGVHHSGKDKERGMRGSTVLLGACDASIRITKNDELVTLKTEKQKDAEEAEPIYLKLKKVTWATGFEEEQSTLVPFRSEVPEITKEDLDRARIAQAFGIMADAWEVGRPLSHRTETRRDGRYAPVILSQRLGGDASLWAEYLTAWLENGNVIIEVANKNTKVKGLQVVDPIT